MIKRIKKGFLLPRADEQTYDHVTRGRVCVCMDARVCVTRVRVMHVCVCMTRVRDNKWLGASVIGFKLTT